MDIWSSPFVRQCFVIAGISLNLGTHGFAVGYPAILLPQLRQPSSSIHVDESIESWIAAVPSIFQVLGNFTAPPIMNRYGRRILNLITIIAFVVLWLILSIAESYVTIIICRALQGLSMGMGMYLAPILIGEYASPENRGAFLTTISLSVSIGMASMHTLGSYYSWQLCAVISSLIVFAVFFIAYYSPESPYWLAEKGHYKKTETVFRWLRGDKEEEDLKRLISESIKTRNENISTTPASITGKIKDMFINFRFALTQKDFYKPVFIMVHVNTIGVSSGGIMLMVYLVDLVHMVLGPDANVAAIAISLGAQRIISNILAIYIVKKVKRKTIVYCACTLNMLVVTTTAMYYYCKINNLLPFDHPAIGIVLMHVHIISSSGGIGPIPFVIAGEIFPLKFKSLGSTVSILFSTFAFFVVVKSVPYAIKSLGLHYTYLIFVGIMMYVLIIVAIFLPETKDKTLQEIEDEIRGRPLSPEELKSIQPLDSWKERKLSRRCSSPINTA